MKRKLEPGQLAKLHRKAEFEQAKRHVETPGKKGTCKHEGFGSRVKTQVVAQLVVITSLL